MPGTASGAHDEVRRELDSAWVRADTTRVLRAQDRRWNAPGYRRVLHHVASPNGPSVVVYWRPGCPYCARLRRAIRRIGLVTDEVDIWQDPVGAAAVRTVTGGDETVPTVVVGEVSLVNPSIAQLVRTLEMTAPALVPPAVRRRLARDRVLRTVQWGAVGAAVVGSAIAALSGHSGVSWLCDIVVVVVYVAGRVVRSRQGHGAR